MEVPIESVDDLADQTAIEYGTMHGGSTMTFFQVRGCTHHCVRHIVYSPKSSATRAYLSTGSPRSTWQSMGHLWSVILFITLLSFMSSSSNHRFLSVSCLFSFFFATTIAYPSPRGDGALSGSHAILFHLLRFDLSEKKRKTQRSRKRGERDSEGW